MTRATTNNHDALVTAATQLVAEFDQHGEVLQLGHDDDLGLYGPTSAIEQLRTAASATPIPLACPSDRHAADNPCRVDCAVCRDECWPDIVRATNAHDALVEALGLAYEALSGSDEQTETASAAAYDALEAAK